MSVELDHTIVWTRDKDASARFLAEILGVDVGAPTGPFVPVRVANGVILDYATTREVLHPQHYAFRVDDASFDAAFARLRATGVTYWADPMHRRPGEINAMNGGRGVYFADPDGHNMELLTRGDAS